MVYFMIRHTVENYEKWRVVFDGDHERRVANGQSGAAQVHRDVENPNVITVVIEWDSAERVEAFSHDPVLIETMQKAGVLGPPSLVAVMTRA